MAVTVCLPLVIVSTTSLVIPSLASEVIYHKNGFDFNYNNSCISDSQCPTWYFCDNATKQCKCGKSFDGMVQCNEESGTA